MAARRVVVNHAAVARVRRELRARGDIARAMERISVTVGIHEEEGDEVAAPGSPATLAEVAFFNEMGTSRIPRRSWLADGLEENDDAIHEAFRRAARAMITKRIPVDVGYLQFGEFVVAKLQGRIRGGIAPPNAPSTVERKGSSVPLIDEGRFIASIRAKVRQGGE